MKPDYVLQQKKKILRRFILLDNLFLILKYQIFPTGSIFKEKTTFYSKVLYGNFLKMCLCNLISLI